MKKISFTKKINSLYTKQEMKSFSVVAICGYCEKIDKYTEIVSPKEYGWIYVNHVGKEPINNGKGAWFCCDKCYRKQMKFWGFK